MWSRALTKSPSFLLHSLFLVSVNSWWHELTIPFRVSLFSSMVLIAESTEEGSTMGSSDSWPEGHDLVQPLEMVLHQSSAVSSLSLCTIVVYRLCVQLGLSVELGAERATISLSSLWHSSSRRVKRCENVSRVICSPGGQT